MRLEPGDLARFVGNPDLVMAVRRMTDSHGWEDDGWGHIDLQYPCFVVEASDRWPGFWIVMISGERWYRVNERLLVPV